MKKLLLILVLAVMCSSFARADDLKDVLNGVRADQKLSYAQYLAKQGDADAQYYLGKMYEKGEGVIQDHVLAQMWYNLAASNGNVNGRVLRDLRATEMTPTQIAKAQRMAEYCKKTNYCDYISGDLKDGLKAFVKEEYAKAFKLLQPEAAIGDSTAQSTLGTMYFLGHGVTQDKKEAVRLYRKAADQGLAEAQYALGRIYSEGEGVDREEAAKWFRKAAEQGEVDAQFHLGSAYSSGEGVTQDKKEAVKWFRKAAEQGHMIAQFFLGWTYQMGKNVTQDYKEAVKWYRMAAEQGYAKAQSHLGSIYDSGQGVTQNYKEAVKWLRLSAEQGDTESQHNLGAKYANGQGVTKNYVQAHMWLNLAASNGEKIASKYREIVAKKMTPDQVSKAQDMARDCKKKNYKNCDLSYKERPAELGIGVETRLAKEKKEKKRKIKEQDVRVAAETERLKKELREEEERRRLQKLAYAKAAAKRSLIDEFKAKILAKIKTKLVLPPDLPNDPVAEFDITLLPGGGILSVKLRNSSGFRSFDEAVERAIILARPLPLPKDKLLFPNFRYLVVKVHYLDGK